jgi:dipeptidase
MCDTFVAPPNFTANQATIFGKNSDREPNEAQSIVRIPKTIHAEKEVKLTFISIPQVQETYEVLLSKPFHIWGAEMGTNEFGLAIGNEAVFTRIKIPKTNTGLTGMDMLRLALERTKTAKEALFYITELIAQYGQDACGGYLDRNFFYHNSFLIADPTESFVLETAGKEWVAERVKSFRSISNGLSIGEEFDFSSPNLVENTRKLFRFSKYKTFNFSQIYSDLFFTFFGKCKLRQAQSMKEGKSKCDVFDIGNAIAILRTHSIHNHPFDPKYSGMDSLCLHAGGITVPSQTTASMVAELRPDKKTSVWLTGTSAPCLSTFKPFFMNGYSLSGSDWKEPGAYPDDSLWWMGEKLHRKVLTDYQSLAPLFLHERDQLELSFFQKEQVLFSNNNFDFTQAEHLSQESLLESIQKLKEWIQKVSSNMRFLRRFSIYQIYWKLQNARVIFNAND